MWRLLRGGNFRWVWAGESISMLGDHFHEIALAWLVLSIGGSPLTLGAALVGLLVVLVMAGWVRLWQLYLIEVAFGIADAFFYPAVGSITAELVEKHELPSANALVSISEQVAMLAGPAVGGVLVATAGVAGAFLFNCA